MTKIETAIIGITIRTRSFVFLLMLILGGYNPVYSQNISFSKPVGISTASFVPDPSSILEIQSNSKGLLIPRMTTAERDAIISPADGLLIFNTDIKEFNYYEGGAMLWNLVGTLANAVNANLTGPVTSVGNATSVTNDAITNVMIAPGTSGQVLMSNSTPATAWTTMSGDATINNTGILTIEDDAITTAKINNAAVTLAKMENRTAATLIGNPTAGSATPSEITLGAGLVFNGTQLITKPLYTPANFGLTSTQLTTGNYTVPAGVYTITIEAVGGSGGGGGSGADRGNNNGRGATGGGGGGGAGEYVGTFLAVTPGDIIQITYGAAGSAGTAGPNSGAGDGGDGGDGGITIVKDNSGTTILTANGGLGGNGSVGNANVAGGQPGGVSGAGGSGSSDPQHTNGTSGTNGTASSGSTTLGAAGPGGSGPQLTGTATNVGGNGGAGVYTNAGGRTVAGNSGGVGGAGMVVISYY